MSEQGAISEEEEFEFRLRSEQEAARSKQQPADAQTLPDQLMGYGQDAMSALTAPVRGAAQVFSGAAGDIGALIGWDALRDKGRENKAYFQEDEKRRMEAITSLPTYIGTSLLAGGYATKTPAAVSTVLGKTPQMVNSALDTIATKGPQIVNSAKGLGKRMIEGGLTGLGYGAFTPAESDEQKAAIMVGGGLFGAGLPALTTGLSKTSHGAKNLAEGLMKGGNERITARTMQQAAGQDRARIIGLLDENQQLPGGRSGAGEVAAPAGNAEFSGIQKIAEGRQPTKYGRMAAADNAAREKVLTDISGGEAKIASLEASRKATAAANYKAAFAIHVDGDAELGEILKDPFVARAIRDMKPLAESSGVTGRGSKSNNVTAEKGSEYLHLLKLSLDKMMKPNAVTPLDTFERTQVRAMQTRIVNWLEAKNPAYKHARTQFSVDSKDIDKRKVAQQLRDKLVTAKDDIAPTEGIVTSQNASAYGDALRNEHTLIKTATGDKRYNTLAEVLGEDGANAAKSTVGGSRARRQEYELLSQRGSSAVKDLIDESATAPPASGMFNPKYSVFRSVVSGLQGRVRGESMKLMEEAFKNPAEASRLLKMVIKEDQPLVFEAMKNIQDATIKAAGDGIKTSGSF